MTSQSAKDLFLLGLTRPDQALRHVAGFGLSARTIWTILLLITVLSSLASSLALHALPQDQPELQKLIQEMLAYNMPVLFCAMQFAQAAFGIYVIAFIGKSFDGVGRPQDIALGYVVIQIVAFLLALVIALAAQILPSIGVMGITAILIWGIWASVVMINEAHGFHNNLKALGVLFLAGLVMMVASLAMVSLFDHGTAQGLNDV